MLPLKKTVGVEMEVSGCCESYVSVGGCYSSHVGMGVGGCYENRVSVGVDGC